MNPCTACSCSGSNPTAVLKSEHRVIERVLTALERFAAQENIDVDLFAQSIDFLRAFADRCHHAKEEGELFPRLEATGVPREGGPIGCMLEEHAQGRVLIQRMAEQLESVRRGEPSAAGALRTAARQYVALLRTHIWKEDNVLFQMADRALTPEAQVAAVGGFNRTETAEANPGNHERYVQLADELLRRSLQISDAGASA